MLTLTDDYRFLAAWQGRLVVTTTTEAGGGPYVIEPGDHAGFHEHGLSIQWAGDQPGVFLPWGSVAAIRQAPHGAPEEISGTSAWPGAPRPAASILARSRSPLAPSATA